MALHVPLEPSPSQPGQTSTDGKVRLKVLYYPSSSQSSGSGKGAPPASSGPTTYHESMAMEGSSLQQLRHKLETKFCTTGISLAYYSPQEGCCSPSSSLLPLDTERDFQALLNSYDRGVRDFDTSCRTFRVTLVVHLSAQSVSPGQSCRQASRKTTPGVDQRMLKKPRKAIDENTPPQQPGLSPCTSPKHSTSRVRVCTSSTRLEAGWDRCLIQNIVQSVRKHHFSSQLVSPRSGTKGQAISNC